MYLSSRKHVLSGTILKTAAVNAGAVCIQLLIRLFIRLEAEGRISQLPDMVNRAIDLSQNIISMVQIFLTAGIFFFAISELRKSSSVVEEDDREAMAALQQEVFGKSLAALDLNSIYRLVQIWAVILVGGRIMYEVSAELYEGFIRDLMVVAFEGQDEALWFVSVYNSTHGFKYSGMLIAIITGIVMTGIFLNDRTLKIVSLAVIVLFLLSFALLKIQTVQLFGLAIGVVWTSVIFHLVETVGMVMLAVYLRRHYNGI